MDFYQGPQPKKKEYFSHPKNKLKFLEIFLKGYQDFFKPSLLALPEFAFFEEDFQGPPNLFLRFFSKNRTDFFFVIGLSMEFFEGYYSRTVRTR